MIIFLILRFSPKIVFEVRDRFGKVWRIVTWLSEQCRCIVEYWRTAFMRYTINTIKIKCPATMHQSSALLPSIHSWWRFWWKMLQVLKKKIRHFPKSTINVSSLYAGRPKIGIFFAVIMLGQLFSVDILSSDLRHRAAYFVCIDVSGAKVLH